MGWDFKMPTPFLFADIYLVDSFSTLLYNMSINKKKGDKKNG